MQSTIIDFIKNRIRDKDRRRKYVCLLLCLSMLVTSAVIWELRLTGVSMTSTDEPTCGVQEHTHSADCYDADGNLICGLTEHVHTAACYSDSTADVETADVWETTLPQKTGIQADDLVAVAESQLGYQESTRNYAVADDGTLNGYTRYGAWYGNSYGPWNAMFISFCLHYAGISEEQFPYCSGGYAWTAKLQDAGIYRDSSYSPKKGDVVFFDRNGDGEADDTGIVTGCDNGSLSVISGDRDNAVSKYTCFVQDAFGYGAMPETEPTSATPDVTTEDTHSAEKSADAQQGAESSAETNSAHTADGTVYGSRTFEYSDSDVIITAVADPEAGLPENTKLSVTLVQDDTVQYHDAAAKSEAVVGEKPLLQKIYNICMISDGAEVEPQAGSVRLHFDFTLQPLTAPGDSTAGVDVRVIHIEDSQSASEIPADAVVSQAGAVESLDFSAKNFSLYSISLLPTTKTTLSEKNYGNYHFSYNTIKDAFTTSAYSEYYSAARPLGIAGNFHLVGFKKVTLNVHCNGNILANQLYANSNFGTNAIAKELSYIVDYKGVASVSAARENDVLVIGDGNTVSTADNGTALTVNNIKLDKPKNVIQDSNSKTAPFIDLTEVNRQITDISNALGIVAPYGVVADFADMNNMSLLYSGENSAGYYSITAAELKRIFSNGSRPLAIYLSKDTGSMVINVDCKGFSGQSINLPDVSLWYNNKKCDYGEVADFSTGKVIWNFTNATGVTINTNRMYGSVIALGATVNLQQNLNGTVIAENINVNAESHRTDFTGTTVPGSYSLSASLIGTKQLNGQLAGMQAFRFNLEKLDNGGSWTRISTATQLNGSIRFDSVSWKAAGTYWYRISEQTTGYEKALQNGYIFDNTIYLVKVVAAADVTKSTITYYKLNDGQTTELGSDGTVNMDFVTEAADGAVFRNKTAYTFPSTGGTGTIWYTVCGFGLMAACLFLSFRLWRKRKGGYRVSTPS